MNTSCSFSSADLSMSTLTCSPFSSFSSSPFSSSTSFYTSSRSRNSSGGSISSSTHSFLEDDDQYQKVANQLVHSITEVESPTTISYPLKPKHLKLLFGTDTEKRITGMNSLNFNGALAESDSLETATLSYYDFPPEEEARLMAIVDRRCTAHLTVAINDYDDCLLLDTVRRLISQALVDAPLLCSVQLYINWSRNSRDGSNNNNFRPCIVHVLSLFRLLETLNSLRGLQRLTVIVDHPVFNTIPADNPNAQLDLSPVLSHLREFNFSTGDELQTTPVLGWLEKAVAEANTPLSLQSIRLGNPDLRHSLTEFTDRHPALGALILELPRVFWSNPSVFVSRSLCSLPSLSHLSLRAHSTEHLFGLLYAAGAGAGKWNNGGAAAAVAPITQNLTSLSIRLNTWSPSTGHAPLAAFDHHLLFPTIFPAVRSLRLIAHVRSHRDLHSPLWAALFPSLEHIELAHNCVSCNLCPNRPGRLTTKARAQVAKLFEETLFTPFKACARLSTLNVRKDGGKWAQSYVVTQVNGWKVPLKVGQSSTTCRARGRGSSSHRRSSSTSSNSSTNSSH
ncbi:hypothetical protein TYRP_003527 [Tyrophagus putrescentiae]|nr:hypothetical protein TYRP_003527 [Tyrophagus putrescentiae]